MDITLIGGGWDLPAQLDCLRPFVDAATARAAGATPRVAFVWVDEQDGTHWGLRWVDLVTKAGTVDALDVAVPIGTALEVARINDVHGLFVCGGLTPAYAEAVAPVAADVRRMVVDDGLPYAGSSAGAAVAATSAVVGGYLDGDRVVCPADAAEDLDPVTVVPGLGLVAEMVDVHASAWGTLPRLAAAMRIAPSVTVGLAIDEDTAWHVTDAGSSVRGRNAVHRLTDDGGDMRWSVVVA